MRSLIFQILILSILTACTNEDAETPCIICPIDFNATDSEPAWSPDGQWIAFGHGDVPGKVGIYLISLNGQEIQQWHQGPANAPAWSSDGQWIAFSENAQIWKKQLNGDSLTQLTFEGSNFYPAWSPDGRWIAFDAFIKSQTSLYAIWKMENDGNNKILIAHSPENGAARMPHWVGDNIVHIRYLKDVYSSEIFLMNQGGENVVRLTSNEATDYYPKFSKNETRIAFTSKYQYSP